MLSRAQLIEELMSELGSFRRVTHGAGEHMLSKFGLTRPQAALLFSFEHQASFTVGELADRLGVSTGAVTQMTDIMARRQLVVREVDAADRRVSQLALTPAGRSLAAEVQAFTTTKMTALLEVLSDEELTQFKAVMGKLNHAVQEKTKRNHDKKE